MVVEGRSVKRGWNLNNRNLSTTESGASEPCGSFRNGIGSVHVLSVRIIQQDCPVSIEEHAVHGDKVFVALCHFEPLEGGGDIEGLHGSERLQGGGQGDVSEVRAVEEAVALNLLQAFRQDDFPGNTSVERPFTQHLNPVRYGDHFFIAGITHQGFVPDLENTACFRLGGLGNISCVSVKHDCIRSRDRRSNVLAVCSSLYTDFIGYCKISCFSADCCCIGIQSFKRNTPSVCISLHTAVCGCAENDAAPGTGEDVISGAIEFSIREADAITPDGDAFQLVAVTENIAGDIAQG